MNTKLSLFFLYSITIVVISFLLYLSIKKSNRISTNLPLPHASFETHWWSHSIWRPWWRKYNGLPGFTPVEGKPLPKPKMPVVPQSYIIPNRPRVIN